MVAETKFIFFEAFCPIQLSDLLSDHQSIVWRASQTYRKRSFNSPMV